MRRHKCVLNFRQELDEASRGQVGVGLSIDVKGVNTLLSLALLLLLPHTSSLSYTALLFFSKA